MGAGIPREIPGVLDAFAEHRPARIRFDVEGLAPGEAEYLTFDPQPHGADASIPLDRPRFIPIVAAHSLAATLARKATGRVDGFVVEGPTAGGHNAPPRGELRLNERGEPLYGERDAVNLDRLRELELPFWLAGGAGSPVHLRQALTSGAAGVQVGTLFAYCEESGLADQLKRTVLEHARRGDLDVFTDPRASPTGYPFKVVRWPGSDVARAMRTRRCDLGYLRTPYRREDGRIGYRCPAEPVEDYVAKGGARADTDGRQCLCNGLMANIGHPQLRDGGIEEPPLLTSGDDLLTIRAFLGARTSYTAADVIDYLLGEPDLASGSSIPTWREPPDCRSE
jgi:NAD(P)H-dependent flavin oxidoreductase YrpB (nitropropane dioxygenase family)